MDGPTLPLAVLEAVAKIERRARLLLAQSREALSSNPEKAAAILQACAAEAFDRKAEGCLTVKADCSKWLEKSAEDTLKETLALLGDEDLKIYLRDQSRREIRKKVRATLNDRITVWKKQVRSESLDPRSRPAAASKGTPEEEKSRRTTLLAEYRQATGNPSNKRIYEAKNSGIHKPQFYDWLNGKLRSDSATAINFERFLRLKKLPVPRKERNS